MTVITSINVMNMKLLRKLAAFTNEIPKRISGGKCDYW